MYLLATTERTVRWYCIKTDRNGTPDGFGLLERLDLKKVSVFGDKKSAKYAALTVGLKTWRYVKI